MTLKTTLKTTLAQALLAGLVLSTAFAVPSRAQNTQLKKYQHSYHNDVSHGDEFHHRLSNDYVHMNQLRHEKGPRAAAEYRKWDHNRMMDYNQGQKWHHNKIVDSSQGYRMRHPH